jgi:hypothetical protein
LSSTFKWRLQARYPWTLWEACPGTQE